MIVVGTGGHALEVLQILAENGLASECVFYDDLSAEIGEPFRSFRLLRSPAEARAELSRDRRVVLALGRPAVRRRLAETMRALGGELEEVRASSARVGSYDVELGAGLNVMHGVLISGGARVGDGAAERDVPGPSRGEGRTVGRGRPGSASARRIGARGRGHSSGALGTSVGPALVCRNESVNAAAADVHRDG